LGTAILAGVAIGKYSDYSQAVAQLVHSSETVIPDSSLSQTYKTQKKQYELLYSSLAPFRVQQAQA